MFDSEHSRFNNILSFFKLHNDGFAIHKYNLRLSNIPKNIIRLATWTVGISGAAGSTVGISSINDRTHYRISIDDKKIQMEKPLFMYKFKALIWDPLITAFSEGQCNIRYDQSRQDEYNMGCKTIYYLTPKDFEHYGPTVTFCRGYLQPILVETEDCIKNLLNQTVTYYVKDVDKVAQKDWQNDVDKFVQIAPYALVVAGIFTAGLTLIDKLKPPIPLSFADQLKSIDYEDQVDPDFCCPISKGIMNDPVKTNDGFTYDRVSIEAWLAASDSPVSPINRNVMIDSSLIIPNEELKLRIKAFVSEEVKKSVQNRANRPG